MYQIARASIIAAQEAAIASRLIRFALVWILFSPCANAAELYGKVIAVSDGDSLTLLDESRVQHKVRLFGIDAPERRQAYGDRARQHLSDLAHGRFVRVEWEKRDRYGRIVGRVLAAECPRAECGYSVDIGLEQIKAGLAWHYRQYAKEQALAERMRYAWLEQRARAQREGLWQQPDPTPPWAYRSNERLKLDSGAARHQDEVS